MSELKTMTFIARIDEVEAGYALKVPVEGREPVALVRLEGGYFVLDDTCTHGAASMSEGDIIGCEIECPFHGGRFDIRTGAATTLPCVKALTIYPVMVEGDEVYAALDAGVRADESTSLKEPRMDAAP